QLSKAALTVIEESRDLALDGERVRQPAQCPQRQPVGHAILHPGARRSARSLRRRPFDEPMEMLPAREGPPQLDIDEAMRRIELTDEDAPGQGQAARADAEVDHRARRQG